LVVRAMRELFQHLGTSLPPLRVSTTNRIPMGRGLGSSAAAIVGGLVAANAWAGNPLSRDELLALATQIEGHPDNVSAALLGGLTIVVADGARLVAVHQPPPRRWRAVLFIPEQALSTKFARKILPARLSRADAVYNIGRAALLVHALASGDAELLKVATSDRLHQPYRARLVPGMLELFEAALQAGALGVALSGAGPSLIAFANRNPKSIATAFEQRARELQIPGSTRAVGLSAQGARVERA
jgi:homoserine kinase